MTSSATNPDRGAQSRAGKAVHFKTQPDGPGGGRPCWGLWSSHPRPGWARRARRTRQQQASGVAAGWSRCAGGAAPPAGRHGHRRGEGRSGLPGGRRLAPVAALCCPRVGVRPRLGLTRLLGPGGKRLLLGLAVVRGLLASLIGLGRLGARRGLLSGLRGGGGGSLGGLGRLLLFRGGLSGSLSLGLGSGLLRQAALLLSLLVRLLLLLQLLLLPLRNGLSRALVSISRAAPKGLGFEESAPAAAGGVSEASVTVRFVRFSLGLPARVAEAAAGDEAASLPSRDSEGDMARASGLMLLRHALSAAAAVGALSGLSRDS